MTAGITDYQEKLYFPCMENIKQNYYAFRPATCLKPKAITITIE